MSPVERQIGPHVSRRELPDSLFLTIVGDLDEEHATAMVAEMQDIGKDGTSILILADVSRLGRISPAARIVATDGSKAVVTRAIAIIGAGFQQRVLVTLIIKAFALLRKESMIPMVFFEKEAEARVWIEEQRRSR